jgi:hypothetical protein
MTKLAALFTGILIGSLVLGTLAQADSGKISGNAQVDAVTGQLVSSQSPRPFVPVNGPITVAATGSKTQTFSTTSTAYQTVTATFTATGSGVSAGTDSATATGTATGTLTATTTQTGLQTLTLNGTATGTSTGTQWTAEIGNPSTGTYLFNVNNLWGIDKTGAQWLPQLGSGQLHLGQEFNAPISGPIYMLYSNKFLRIAGFDWDGNAYLGGLSNAGGADAPVTILGLNGLYDQGQVWLRGSRYDPTQLTTTPILRVGGSAGGLPEAFRVLGNGKMYSQNTLTLQGGLVATYEKTSTATATATDTSGLTYPATTTTTSTATGTGPFVMGGNMTLGYVSTLTSSSISFKPKKSAKPHPTDKP